MKKPALYFLLALLGAPLLAACSADCHCPQCHGRTTVVTPPPDSSTTIPNDD